MGRVPPDGGWRKSRPGCAAVVAERLPEMIGELAFAVVAGHGDEAAAGGLDHVRFVALAGIVALGLGDAGDAGPGAAVVARFQHAGAFLGGFSCGASDVEQPPVAELDGPVRRGRLDADVLAPGLSVVFRTANPRSEPLVYGLGGELLAVAAVQVVRFKREAREPAHYERACARLEDARVAVVQGRVVDRLGRGPCGAVIAAPNELRFAPGTDVRVAVARKHRQQFTFARIREGGPADVDVRGAPDVRRREKLAAG